MESNIKLLEERVLQAVERLRTLSAERDQLREDLRGLRERLEVLEKRYTGDESGPSEGGWQAQAEEVADALRQALQELRGR